jgi:hypothetical protein
VLNMDLSPSSKLKFPTRLQRPSKLMQGKAYDDGKDYNMFQYVRVTVLLSGPGLGSVAYGCVHTDRLAPCICIQTVVFVSRV